MSALNSCEVSNIIKEIRGNLPNKTLFGMRILPKDKTNPRALDVIADNFNDVLKSESIVFLSKLSNDNIHLAVVNCVNDIKFLLRGFNFTPEELIARLESQLFNHEVSNNPEGTSAPQETLIATLEKDELQEASKNSENSESETLFKTFSDEFYATFGKDQLISTNFTVTFRQNFIDALIYDTSGSGSKSLNFTQYDINKSLAHFLNSLLVKILKFLVKKGGYDHLKDLKFIEQSTHAGDSWEIRFNKPEIIQLIKAYRAYLKNIKKETFRLHYQNQLESKNVKNFLLQTSELSVAYAYLMFTHFDELILKHASHLIEFNEDDKDILLLVMKSENSQIDFNLSQKNKESTERTLSKYRLKLASNELTKSWSVDEFQDAFKHIGELQKMMLESTPLRSASTQSLLSQGSIKVSDIGIAWNSFLDRVRELPNDPDTKDGKLGRITRLKGFCQNVYKNPNYYIPLIFDLLFGGEKNGRKKLIDTLLKVDINLRGASFKFSEPNLNVLYSIYVKVFQNANSNTASLSYIEDKTLKKSGLRNIMLSDILISTMCGIAPARFISTTNTRDEIKVGHLRVDARTDKRIFDHMLSLNLDMATMSSKTREELINDYNVQIIDPGHIVFKIGESTYHAQCYENTESGVKPSRFIDRKQITIYEELSSEIGTMFNNLVKDDYIKNIFEFCPTHSEVLAYLQNLKETNEEIASKSPDAQEAAEAGQIAYEADILLLTLVPVEDAMLKSFGKINKDILLHPSKLTPDSKDYDTFVNLRMLLSLSEEMLNLDLLSDLGIDVLYTTTTQGNPTAPAHILKAAVSALYMHKFMLDSLKDGFDAHSEEIFSREGYNTFKFDYGIVTREFGQPAFRLINPKDTWLESYFNALAYITGDTQSATTKDYDGNSRSNYRETSVATEYAQILNDLRNNEQSALSEGLFVKNPSLIVGVGYDTQVLTSLGDEFTLKVASTSELIYHAITDNFWTMFTQGGHINIMPTVYSDKTAFVTYEINANGKVNIYDENGNLIGKPKSIMSMSNVEYESMYKHLIGTYFRQSFTKTIKDLSKVLYYASLNSSSTPSWVNTIGIDQINLLNSYGDPKEVYKIIDNILHQIDKDTLENYLSQYNNANANDKVNLCKELHYRYAGNHLLLNELLVEYGTKLFNQTDLHKRFAKEKRTFLEQLLENNVNFLYNDRHSESSFQKVIRDKDLALYQLYRTAQDDKEKLSNEEAFERKWVNNGKLVLARTLDGREIYNINQLTGADFELNPLLEKYFYVDNLMSANLKYALVGSELVDPVKGDFSISKGLGKSGVTAFIELATTKINKNSENYESEVERITKEQQKKLDALNALDLNQLREFFRDHRTTFFNGSETTTINGITQEEFDYLAPTLELLLYERISAAEGALYKRNVIIPATRSFEQLNSLIGLGNTTKVAIISDVKADIFNYIGESDDEDANDGSARINPYLSILENYSMGADQVGFHVKKPIWYHYDPATGQSVLLKFATFAISNASMQMSEKSAESLRKLFKKMTNIRWGNPTEWDLTNSNELRKIVEVDEKGNVTKITGKNLLFQSDICNLLIDGTSLYYEDNGKIYQIKDFKKLVNEDGSYYYYTVEKDVTTGEEHLVATLFNDASEAIRIRQNVKFSSEILEHAKLKLAALELSEKDFHKNVTTYINEGLHTTDSLYELHETLGGIRSKAWSNVSNEFVDSENSNYAVVGFMNAVQIEDERFHGNNLLHYRQPLKNFHIGYAANISAVKRGLFNVNSEDAWKGDRDLQYVELSNAGLGVQMDPDHDADEAHVSEMTLVMASLDVGGELHDIAKSAFLDLGKLIANGIKLEQDTLAEFLATKTGLDKALVASKMYDIIVREFLRNYTNNNEFDLGNIIVDAIQKHFEVAADDMHSADIFKLPTSDPNVFRHIVQSFISKINKLAIKRKYSGQSAVMVPGFNVALIFHFLSENGEEPTMFKDLVRRGNEVAYTYKGQNFTKTFLNLKLSNLGKIHTINLKGELIAGLDRITQIDEHTSQQIFTFDMLYNPSKESLFAGIALYKTDNEDGTVSYQIQVQNLNNLNELLKLLLLLAVYDSIETGANVSFVTESSDGSISSEKAETWYTLVDLLGFKENPEQVTKMIVGDPSNFVLDSATKHLHVLEHLDPLPNRPRQVSIQFPTIKKWVLDGNARNILLADAYLKVELLKDIYIHDSANVFEPTDIVNIIDALDKTKQLKTIDLNQILTYYQFKFLFTRKLEYMRKIRSTVIKMIKLLLHAKLRAENPETPVENIIAKVNSLVSENYVRTFLSDKINFNHIVDLHDSGKLLGDETLNIDLKKFDRDLVKFALYDQIKFLDNVTIPRNLRPLRISFELEGTNVRHNLYDLDAVFNQHIAQVKKDLGFDTKTLELWQQYFSKKYDELSNDIKSTIVKELYVSQQINNLSLNQIVTIDSDSVLLQMINLMDNNIVTINGNTFTINPDSLVNEAAEMLASNVHKTKFHQYNYTLNLMLQKMPIYPVKVDYIKDCEIILKGKHKKKGVTFVKPENAQGLKPKVIIKKDPNKGDGLYYIYKESKETHREEYKVGVLVETENLYTTDDGGLTIYHIAKTTQGTYEKTTLVTDDELNSLIYKDGKIYKQEYFVQNLKVSGNDTTFDQDYTILYIDKNSKYVTKDEIAEILNKILTVELYDHVLLNERINFDFAHNEGYLYDLLLRMKKEGPKFKIQNLYLDLASAIIKQNLDRGNKNIDLSDENKILYTTKSLTYKEHLEAISRILAKLLKNHFELSRMFTAARIPAQSLQSYMQMKCVGFIPVSSNLVMVSHWQTWLQGSDYDIDKAYMMGFDFDNNGYFRDWSNLFDYSSKETTLASLELPTPNGVKISLTVQNDTEGIDITEDLTSILVKLLSTTPKVKALAIREIAKLLRKLENEAANNTVKVIFNPTEAINLNVTETLSLNDLHERGRELVKALDDHEHFYIAQDDFESAIKNSISGRVLAIVSNTKNIVNAYSPITMKDLRKQADNSPKGKLIEKLTGMNPVTKFIMLKLNMEGREVIGISAIGEKVFMGLTYYFNEAMRTDPTSPHYQFEYKTTRIQDRHLSKSLKSIICKPKLNTKITDLNFNGVDGDALANSMFRAKSLYDFISANNSTYTKEQIWEEVNKQLRTKSGADLLISQLLSAATDNAKELILSKINANAMLAGTYIDLLILGYDLKDVVSFMTSPAVSVVASLVQANRFNEFGKNSTRVEDAIAVAKGCVLPQQIIKHGVVYVRNADDVSTKISVASNLKKTICSRFENEIDFSKAKNLDDKLILISERLTNDPSKKDSIFYIDNFRLFVLEQISTENLKINKLDIPLVLREAQFWLDSFITQSLIKNDAIASCSYNDYMADLNEFENIFTSAKETRYLGAFMSMSREIPVDFAKFMTKINTFESRLQNACNEYKWVDPENPDEKHSGLEFEYNDATHEFVLTEKCKRGILLKKPFLVNTLDKIIKNAQKSGIITHRDDKSVVYNLDFVKFMENDTYRDNAISLYDVVKQKYNIYDVMVKSPQYEPVLQAYKLSSQMVNYSSLKASMLNEMRKTLKEDNGYLQDRDISKLRGYVDELLIKKFLLEHDFQFPVMTGQDVMTKLLDVILYEGVPTWSQIKTDAEIESFKIYIEQVLLPSIRKGKVLLPGMEEPFDIDPLYRAIAKYLITGKDSGHTVKMVAFNTGQIADNTVTQLQYKKAIDSLEGLDAKNPDDSGVKLKELLMLYNLITFKNNPGNDRMSALFNYALSEFSIDSEKNNLLMNYLQETGELDFEHKERANDELHVRRFLLQILGFRKEDAQFKLAKIYNERDLEHKSYRSEMFAYVRTRSEKIELRQRQHPGDEWKSSKKLDFLRDVTDETLYKQRMSNFMNHSVIFIPFYDEVDSLSKLLSEQSGDKSVALALELLEYLRLVLFKVNC